MGSCRGGAKSVGWRRPCNRVLLLVRCPSRDFLHRKQRTSVGDVEWGGENSFSIAGPKAAKPETCPVTAPSELRSCSPVLWGEWKRGEELGVRVPILSQEGGQVNRQGLHLPAELLGVPLHPQL
uniref:Uncharacterized protein n=1 Tax=Chromera velia CCMP2878 TaxID=1169474 RepID=A0A0G4FJ85_9ALVE|eukprot:Cvel_17338.t1-p1 / transcript=Cvel_17338.t1 / gene=Cvel_17338 / organism=Chromera_velia_CCMP2878 / gene_product=hypothetical protein / transcript_product=hypothetical protein / location=Cvel_scaffold1377:39171-39539(-) / protein_length=123 / sequence_SO=supercontig / SO=protein_coding / is_pseudo=false